MTIRKSKLTKGMFSSTTDLWATPQAFFDELNAEPPLQPRPMRQRREPQVRAVLHRGRRWTETRLGGTKSSAIHPTAEPSARGSRSATRKAASPIRWWSCSSQPVPTPTTSTTTSTTKPNCASSVVACTSTRHRRAHPSLNGGDL